MSGCANVLFNLITAVFLVLTVATGAMVVGIMAGSVEPPIFAPEPTEAVPTLASIEQPTGVFIPTFTPSSTPELSPTPSSTPTDTPTLTPSITLRAAATEAPFVQVPTETPAPEGADAAALLPSPTLAPPSATVTPSPPGPPTATQSDFPFIVQQGTPLMRENYANPSGCNWQGIAGQVITDRGEAVLGVQVRITMPDASEQFTITGTNTAYGPSGWEVGVAAAPTTDSFQVQLIGTDGAPVSSAVQVAFPGSCQENLALINFVQTRPVQ